MFSILQARLSEHRDNERVRDSIILVLDSGRESLRCAIQRDAEIRVGIGGTDDESRVNIDCDT